MQFLPIIASVFSVVGALSKGSQQSEQYETQAKVQEYNAAVTEQRAATTQSVYSAREDQMRRRQRLALGRQRAMAAESGTGIGGSNLDLERQSEIEAELDALNLRYEGNLEAKGLLAQSELERFGGSRSRANASGVKTASYLGAASSALSGYGNYLKVGTPTTQGPTGDELMMDTHWDF